MAEQKTVTIPNPSDIIALLDASVETIKKVSTAVIKLSSIDVNAFVKSSNNLKKIIPGVKAFVNQICDIIEALYNDPILKNRQDELMRLFIDANEYLKDANGQYLLDENDKKIITKSGFTIPSLIAAVSSIFTTMSKSMDELAKGSIDLTSTAKFKLNIIFFKNQLREVIDIIGDMLDDPSLRDVLFNSKTNLKGTIHIFEQLNELLKVINNYGDPKNLTGVMMARVVTFGLYRKTFSFPKPSPGPAGQGINVGAISGSGSRGGSSGAAGLLNQVWEMISSDVWKNLSDKNTLDSVKDITNTFQSILKLTTTIANIGKSLAPIGAYVVLVGVGLKATIQLALYIKEMIENIDSIHIVIENHDTEKVLLEIYDIVNELVKICLFTASVAALAGPAFLGIFAATYLLEYLGELVKTINSISLTIKKKNINKNIIELTAVMGALAGLCGVMALTGALAIKFLAEVTVGFIIVSIMLLSLIGIMKIISSAKVKIISVQASLSLLVLSGVLLILNTVVLLAALVGGVALQSWKMVVRGLGVILISLGLLITIAWISSVSSPILIAGAIAFAILAGTLLVLELAVLTLVGVVAILDKVKSSVVSNALSNLHLMLLGSEEEEVSGLLPTILGCASHMISMLTAIVALTLLTVISAELTTVALMFLSMGKLLEGADIGGVSKNISIMVNTFIEAIDIFSGKGIGGSAKLMVKITGALFAFSQLMLIAGCVTAMAAVIKNIAALDMVEFENGHPTGKRVKMTDDAFREAENNIMRIATFFTDLVTNKLDLDALKQISLSATIKMAELNLIVKSIGGMAKTVQDVASLIIPEFDSDGHPTGKRVKMTDKNFEDATANIGRIVTIFIQSLNTPSPDSGGKSVLDYVDDMSKWQASKLANVLGLGDSISKMVDAVVVINDKADKLNWEQININLSKVIGTIVENGLRYKDSINNETFEISKFIKEVESNWNKIQKSTDTINSIVDNFQSKQINTEAHQKFIDNSIKFIDKANTIDVNKIRTVTDMFGQMTAFSASLNGNIEDLAKVLSEDLVDALTELNNVMKGIKEPTNIVTNMGNTLQQDESKTTTSVAPTASIPQKIDLTGVEDKLESIISKLSNINENIEELS